MRRPASSTPYVGAIACTIDAEYDNLDKDDEKRPYFFAQLTKE